MSKKPEPARGALAGIKADLQRAKEGGKAYDPRGAGAAYSHNFLNQKPWHPLNFRNQIKKFEAEQNAIKEQKEREQGLVEFEQEQEAIKTMSYLSEAEQQRYKDRQSISFMYAKPPGLEAAIAKEQAAAAAKEKADQEKKAAEALAAAANGGNAAGGGGEGSVPQLQDEGAMRRRDLDRMKEDPFANMLKARLAAQNNERFHVHGVGEAQVHGGFNPLSQNQMLLGDGEPGPSHLHQGVVPSQGQVELLPGVVADASDLAELAAMSEGERAAVMKKLRKMKEEQERKDRIHEAEEVLRAAGYDVAALGSLASGGKSKDGSIGDKETRERSKDKKRKGKHKKSKHSRSEVGKGRGGEEGKEHRKAGKEGKGSEGKGKHRKKKRKHASGSKRGGDGGGSSDSSDSSESSSGSGDSR